MPVQCLAFLWRSQVCTKEVVRGNVVAGGHRLTFPKSSLRQCQLTGSLSLLQEGEFLAYKFKDRFE